MQNTHGQNELTTTNLLNGLNVHQICEITKPETMTAIANGIFTYTELTVLDCHQLRQVVKPATITAIYKGTFTMPELSALESHELYEVVKPETIQAIEHGVFTVTDLATLDCHQLRAVTMPETIKAIENGIFTLAELETLGIHQLRQVVQPLTIQSIELEIFTLAELATMALDQLCEVLSPELLEPRIQQARKFIEEEKEIEFYMTSAFIVLFGILPPDLLKVIAMWTVTYHVIEDDTALHIAGNQYDELWQDKATIEALPLSSTLITQHGIFNALSRSVKEVKNSDQQHEFDKQWGLTII